MCEVMIFSIFRNNIDSFKAFNLILIRYLYFPHYRKQKIKMGSHIPCAIDNFRPSLQTEHIDWDAESCDLPINQSDISVEEIAKRCQMKCITASKNILQKETFIPNIIHKKHQNQKINNSLMNFSPSSLQVEEIIKKIKSCRFDRSPNSLKFYPANFYKVKSSSIQKDYEFLQQIGSGSYGKVFKAKQKSSQQFRAIKQLNKKNIDSKDVFSFINEFHHLKELDHPNIIKLFDMYKDNDYFYIVTQLCEGGSLLNFILKYQIKQSIAHCIVLQILAALNYLHGCNILHRDIKLENIVIVKKIQPNRMNNPQIKIIDFGLSQKLNQEQQKTDSYLGTLMYMPPEGLEGVLTISWDIWSLGILIFIMMTNKLPYKFDTNEQLLSSIIKCQINYDIIKNIIDKNMLQFIKACLKKLPSFRPTPSTLLNHPWIKKYKDQQLNKTRRKRTIINLTTYEIKDSFTNLVQAYLTTKKIMQHERQDIADIFNKIDKNKSGFISAGELQNLFNQQSDLLNQDYIQQVFSKFGQIDKRRITFHEFATIMSTVNQKFNRQTLGQAFQFFDETQKGHLSKTKVHRLLKGAQLQEIEQIFREIDQDEDNKIEKQYFITYLEKNNNYHNL